MSYSKLPINNKKYLLKKTIIKKAGKLDKIKEIEKVEMFLHDLQVDRDSMEIVYKSLRDAYLIIPSKDIDQVDLEIRTAYDDLMSQARRLDRSLKKLDKIIKLLSM